MKINIVFIIFIFITFCKTSAWEKSFIFLGGDSTGIFQIDGRPDTDSSRSNIPEKINFNFGGWISSSGSPDPGNLCNYSDAAGIGFFDTTINIGYKSFADTVWEQAQKIPKSLNALEFPVIGHSLIGTSFFHSKNIIDSCKYKTFSQQYGYNRIIYWSNKKMHAKFQIVSFSLIDSTICYLTRCGKADFVNVRFEMSDRNDSSFSAFSARIISPKKRLNYKFIHQIYNLILGRTKQ